MSVFYLRQCTNEISAAVQNLRYYLYIHILTCFLSLQIVALRDCEKPDCLNFRYAFAKEIYNKERGKIAEQLSEARSTGLFLKQGLAAVGEMRSSVDERTRAMIKELNEIFTQCMRTINERYSFLYNQLQNIRNERLLHLDAQKSELEYAFGSIQSSIGFTELTLRNSTQVEVLAMKKYIMDRMKELTGAQYNCVPVADDNIRLTVDGTVMQHLSQLGRIEDTNTSASASLVKGIDAHVVARQMSAFLVQCYDGRGNPRAKGGDRVVVTVQSTDDSALPIKDEKCFQAQVIDRQNGCYSVTYTPITSGDHLVTVFINGMVVKGSPFSVHVQESALSRQPITPGSPSISTNDDGSTLGDPLLHFVNSSQAFEIEPTHPELKRATEDPDAPICSKKFKLEPNDLDSLPDQLFAHSPEVALIKQEHLESANICEQYIQEADAHVSTEACSLSKQLLSASSDPEVKLEDVEPSCPLAPSTSRLLTDQLDDISSSHDFKIKFSESGFLTEAIDPPSRENFKLHSSNFRSDGLPTLDKDHIVAEENDSSTVQNHFPDDSPTHNALYNVNTPEPVFHIDKGDHLVDDRNPEDETVAENHDCRPFESESHAVVSQAFVSEVPDSHESDSFVSDVRESHDSQGFVSDERRDETGSSSVPSKEPSNSEERATVPDDLLPNSDSTTTDKKDVEQGNQKAN